MAGGYSGVPTVHIIGGNPSPPTFYADGQSHSITIDSGATYLLFFINGAWNEPNVFSSGIETAGPYYQGVGPDPDLTAYHQYRITPYYTVNYGGAPTVTNVVHYTSCGGAQTSTPTFGASGGTPFWADYDTTVTYDSPIAGAAGERWKAASGDTTTHTVVSSVSSSGDITLAYYHQYSVTFDYETNDASAITSGTQMGTYTAFGSSNSILAGATYRVTSPASAWVDAGEDKLSYQTYTSTSGTIRWALASSPNSFDVTSSGTIISPMYYHQYRVPASYSTSDSSTPSQSVTLSGTQFGDNTYTLTLTTETQNPWLDNGATWTVNNTIQVSSSTEQWIATTGASGIVNSATTIAPAYTHQYYVNVDDGGHGTPTQASQWVNAGSSFSTQVSSPEVVTADEHRWIVTDDTLSIDSVDSAKTLTFTWTEQYHVTVNGGGHGTPSVSSSWVNAGEGFTTSVVSPEVVTAGAHQWIVMQDTLSITSVNSAQTLTFSWTEQYYITVDSAHGSPTQSSQWVNAGDDFEVSITSPEGDTSHRFIVSGPAAQSISNVDSAQTLTFTWIEQYFITVNANGHGTPSQASQWVDAGSNFSTSVNPDIITPNEHRWNPTDATLNIASVNSAQTLTFQWTEQYYITVESAYGTPTQSSQWVNVGNSFSTSVTSPYVVAEGEHRWIVTDDTLSINSVDSAQKLTFDWQQQYCLTVNSPYGTASGSGWYNNGTYAQINISNIVVREGNDTCHWFTGWNATVEDSPYPYIYMLLMDEPKTVTANWATQYLVTFITNPAGSGTTTPQNRIWISSKDLQIAATPNVGYTFTSWTIIGDITIASTLSNKTTATISGPGTIIANFDRTTPTPSANTITATLTTTGQTYNVGLNGNITCNQMSNVTITPYPSNATTIVSFTVTGESGTHGCSNMTLPKASIPYGTTPVVYIDGQEAPNQAYTEDADNFYIWCTMHFSTHHISITFLTQSTKPSPETPPYLFIGILTLACLAALITLIMFTKQRRK